MPEPNPNIDAKSYPAQVAELSAQLTDPVPDDARAFYGAQITERRAREDGAGIHSALVLDGTLAVVRTTAAAVAAGKLKGFGVVRMRYLLDLSGDLAERVAKLDAAIVGAAGSSAGKTTTLRGSRQSRRQALRILKNLAGSDAEAKARLKEVTKDRERPDERSRSLERLADELEGAIARLPAKVVADAGATAELVAALRSYAKGVLGAVGSTKGARGAVANLYDEMNVLDGRIMKEAQVLAASAREARRDDKSVPAVRNPFAGRKRKKQAPTEPPKLPER